MVDQLTIPEAAAVLGIRQVTARVRLHRARKALRGEPGFEAYAEAHSEAVETVPAPDTSLLYVRRGEA